jgi:hypothetical protein
MSFDAERLYKLLPAVHRIRDAEQGYPLRELIGVIADQVDVVEENLEQLYDNHFVETAAPWALPYLGDLLGIRGLSGGGTLTRAPRSEVGHKLAYRRGKGTAATLELIARDVTGWPARAVEFFERVAATQHVNHVRRHNHAFLSLRPAGDLEFFDSAFETATRTVEVRRIKPSRGKWNIPNVGLFLWRLRAYALTRTPLTPAPAPLADNRHFRFHPLGFDLPLFSLPETEDEFTHLAEPLNVPMPITRRMLAGLEDPDAPNQFHPSADYYGAGRSLVLETATFQPIAASEILVADLGDIKDHLGSVIAWGHDTFGQGQPKPKILLDPMRGRVVFPAAQTSANLATFHYGFSMDLGGGEYDRSRSFGARSGAGVSVEVTKQDPNASTLSTIVAGLAVLSTAGGVVEIGDSDRYPETIPPIDATGRQVEIRGADGCRPTLILGQQLELTGDENGAVTLNGLLIGGEQILVTRANNLSPSLGHLRLRHCTMVRGPQPDLTTATVTLDYLPPLRIESPNTTVEIEGCIIGPIQVGPDVTVRLKNCIVDAGTTSDVALADLLGTGAAGTWRIENCTIRGKVKVAVLELASNTIFLGDLAPTDVTSIWPAALFVQRRQEGCVRFCWLPPRARVPRRYECLPREGGPDVRPLFTSLRLGSAAYGQLGRFCDDIILRGADDESEIGAFHDLFQPQREAHLRTRLEEYLRFGLEAGIFFAT